MDPVATNGSFERSSRLWFSIGAEDTVVHNGNLWFTLVYASRTTKVFQLIIRHPKAHLMHSKTAINARCKNIPLDGKLCYANSTRVVYSLNDSALLSGLSLCTSCSISFRTFSGFHTLFSC